MSVGGGLLMEPRRKGRPAKPTGEGAPLRLPPDLVTMARIIGAARGGSAGDVVAELVRAPLEAAWREFTRAQYEATAPGRAGQGGGVPGRGAEPRPVAETPQAPPRPVSGAASRRGDRALLEMKVRELAAAGMTQRAVAETVGVSLGLVNKILKAAVAGGEPDA